MFRVAVTADSADAEIKTKIAILDKNIFKGDYDLCKIISIDLSESEKIAYGNYWHTYREENANLEHHIGRVY